MNQVQDQSWTARLPIAELDQTGPIRQPKPPKAEPKKVQPPKEEGTCDRCGSKLVHRKDDTEETIRDRLKVYHRETEPLKEFYTQRGLLRKVENSGSIESIDRAILTILGV